MIKYIKSLTIIEILIIIAILTSTFGYYYHINFNRPELKSQENNFKQELVVDNVINAKITSADEYYAGKFYDYYVFTEHGKLFLMRDTMFWFNNGSKILYKISLKNKNKTCSFKVKDHWWYGWSATDISNCK